MSAIPGPGRQAVRGESQSEIEMVSGRPVAKRMEISDQLKQDSRTVFLLEEVSFDVELENSGSAAFLGCA